jgi:two-component system NtrC family sensor kinase
MKLTIRILAVAFVIVVLITAGAIYLRIRTTYVDFEAQHREVAEDVAAAISGPMREAWRMHGTAGVDGILSSEDHLHSRGLEGRLVWLERGAPPERRSYLPVERWPKAGENGVQSTITTSQSGQRELHVYLPIDLDPDRKEALEVSESLEALDRATVRRIRIDLAALGAMAIVSLGLAYWTGVAWIARPLRALITKTQQIGEGQYDPPLQLKQGTELDELATALNDMCRQLEEHRAAVERETARRLATLEQLRHADRLTTVGRLSAGIAHEIGTPLNVVAGRATLITSGKLSAAEIKSSAATIKSEADRITAIVRHLLDFARLRPPHRAPADLHVLATQTAGLLHQMAQQKSAHIDVVPSGELMALVDTPQIEQVLMNLLTNALHAVSEGGCVRVEVGVEPKRDVSQPPSARISVIDNGKGIPVKDLPHIFEPFFTTKDIGQGTGLGLSIAYGIVQEHGGRIDVTSNPGQGTCFIVYLPLEPNA